MKKVEIVDGGIVVSEGLTIEERGKIANAMLEGIPDAPFVGMYLNIEPSHPLNFELQEGPEYMLPISEAILQIEGYDGDLNPSCLDLKMCEEHGVTEIVLGRSY